MASQLHLHEGPKNSVAVRPPSPCSSFGVCIPVSGYLFPYRYTISLDSCLVLLCPLIAHGCSENNPAVKVSVGGRGLAGASAVAVKHIRV